MISRARARARREQKTFPRPENVSRMTNEEMKTAWEAAEGTITSNEKLVCHFTRFV